MNWLRAQTAMRGSKVLFEERFGELEHSFEKQHDELFQRIQLSRMDVAQHGSRISRFLNSTFTPDSDSRKQAEEDYSLDLLYYLLEDALRGTPEEIKEESKVYLPVLTNAGITSGILDVGCGRGEWLEVLKTRVCKPEELTTITFSSSVAYPCHSTSAKPKR